MSMEIIRDDELRLKVNIYQENIVRIHAGAIDGYQDSLLNRYEFINQLDEITPKKQQNNRLHFGKDYCLTIAPDLSFSLKKGKKILFETVTGYLPGTAPTCFQNQGYLFRATISKHEKLIGFGDQYRQSFLLNGQRESLWIRNQSDYIPVPFFMSSQGYGILFNTTRRLYYDFGVDEPNKYSINVADEYMDIYIFTGTDYFEMIRKYTLLTGRPLLPPMYTFGLWMVANTEIRVHELLQLALEMRKDEIPCDILALEPLWMEKVYDTSLDKNWNEERFPYFDWAKKEDTFIHSLKLMGYHFGLWMLSDYDHTWEEERNIDNELSNINIEENDIISKENLQIAEQDEHFGHLPMLMDKITNPAESYFEHLKKFVDQGVDYFKQDGYAQINVHPDRLYGNKYHDDVMHNIHYMIYTRQMLRGFEAHTGRRGFTMAVSGWVGFQHFSGTWTGDTGGGEQSLCGILQLATVGHALATCDMENDTVEGIHLGLLLPWAQLCSWSYYKYPVYKGEPLKTVFRNYVNLRMQLILFYYSLAREAHLSGKAIARPLHLVYPDIETAYALSRQFMIGDAFIAGVYSNKIVLPAGKWFDYWTGKVIIGRWQEMSMDYDSTLYGGPLLVKAGAIIPLIPKQQYVGEKKLEYITFQIFPSTGISEFKLYLDDGLSLNYKHGKYAEAKLYCHRKDKQIKIFWGEISGTEQYRITNLDYTIELLGETVVKFIEIAKKKITFSIKEQTNRIIIPAIKFGDEINIYI